MATSQEANNPEKARKDASNKAEDAAPAGDQPVLERPAVLWKQMSETQRQAAAHAFWTDPQSQMEHLEINALMARRLNFRMKSVQTMAVDRKVKHLMAMGNVSDGVAGRLLVTFHLATQRPMMGAFLDALGIAHENGLIAEDATPQPDPGEAEGRGGDAAREVSGRGREPLFFDAGAAGRRYVGRPARRIEDALIRTAR